MSFREQIGVSQAAFIAEGHRLLKAINEAKDDESREHAEHDMTHFLMMKVHGRLQEYFASRQAGA